jgi:hypothetical protein
VDRYLFVSVLVIVLGAAALVAAGLWIMVEFLRGAVL